MRQRMKRVWAGLIALVMVCSGAISAEATNSTTAFSDIAESYWAKTYIEDMTSAGLFNGYDDGTFRPENKLTAAEALSLCARVAEKTYQLTDDTIDSMSDAWAEDVEELMDGTYSWFYEAGSVCLGLGILTWSDLESFVNENSLGEPLEKEWFSVYLVRAMGMEKAAEGLSTYVLSYADAEDISSDCIRYVCLLNDYGVVNGDENNNFGPSLSVTRAVCATMLSRVLDYAEENGIYAEMPAEYSSCTVTAGVISEMANTNGKWVFALTNPTTQDTAVTASVSEDVSVYCNNVQVKISDLKTGDYIRICEGGEITGTVVRMISSQTLTAISGTVATLTEESMTVTSENGISRTYALNRYTRVVTPDDTGTIDVIRLDAGYTEASCLVDSDGNVLNVTLSGGTYLEYGLLSSVTNKNDGSYVLGIAGFDGAVRDLTASSNLTVLVNGLSGSLKSSYVGRYVVLYRQYEDDSLAELSIDTVNTYIQGAVKKVSASSTPFTVSVANLDSGTVTIYTVPSATTTTYNGSTITVPNIPVGSYITARVSGTDSLDWISTWPGSVEYTGTLTGITYGYPTTTLKVTDANDVVHSFALDMSDPPTFLRNSASSTISALITGDQLVVTVQYNEVTKIESTPQEANLTGVVQSNTSTLEGSVLTLLLTDGTTATYTVTDSTSILQNGSVISRTSIQPGSTVAMVVTNGRVLSVEVTTASASTSKLEGTVYLLDTSNKQLTLLTADSLGESTPVVVSIPTSAMVLDESGNILSLSKIAIGDSLEIRGSYSGQTFIATIVVILGS